MLGIARLDAQYGTRCRVYLALPEHAARRAGTRRARFRRRDIWCAPVSGASAGDVAIAGGALSIEADWTARVFGRLT